MLRKVLGDALRERNLSSHEAGKEIGVAHTTILRILEGQMPNHSTLGKIANWLGSPPEVLAMMGQDGASGTVSQLLALLNTNPNLAEKLTDVLSKYESGEIADTAVQDILNYIAYRLS